MDFDRKGKCPICKKLFQSEDCPHSWSYINRVLDAAKTETNFERDIKRVKNTMSNK